MNRQNAVTAGSLGVAVLLGRWFLVSQYGADVPFSDGWLHELQEIYQPYLHNTLHFKDFFLRFGEHILFFLKATAFVLFYLSDRWDVMLMLKVQTVFSALTAGFLAYVLPDGREVRWLGLVTLFLLFSGVVGYWNLLVGGDFIFPLSVILACAAFWLTSSPKLNISTATMAAALSGVSMLNMANGVLTSLLCAAMIMLASVRKRDPRLAVIAVLLGVSVCVFLLGTPTDPWGLAAHSSGPFFFTLAAFFRWPDWPLQYSGLVLWVTPILAIFWRTPGSGRILRFAFLIYAWVALNGVAVAYGRAGYYELQARYFDILLAIFVSALLGAFSMPRGIAIVAASLLALWAFALNLRYFPDLKTYASVRAQMQSIEQGAVALESLRPGAGLQYFEEHREITYLMHDDGYARAWSFENDPDTRRIRHSAIPPEFLRAMVALRPSVATEQACTMDDWTAIPFESLTIENATLDRHGEEARLNAATVRAQLFIPKMDASIKAIRIVLMPPAATFADVYVYRGDMLVPIPYRRPLKEGMNTIEININELHVNRLRIDPGKVPGPYLIHRLEVRTCTQRN